MDQVSDWLERERSVANSKLQEILGLDRLAPSKPLKSWVGQDVLAVLPAALRQMASYIKAELLAVPGDSLSLRLDNEIDKT